MLIVFIGIVVIVAFKLISKKPEIPQVINKQAEIVSSKLMKEREQGKFWGGKNSITCPENYECVTYGNFPEKRGTCQIKQ